MAYELITGRENLLKLINDGVIDALPSNAGNDSIDIRLDKELLLESDLGYRQSVDLINGIGVNLHQFSIEHQPYELVKGEFCKGLSMETFNMPSNMIATLTLKSLSAQNGLGHALSNIIHANWSGKLVLELDNNLRFHNWTLRYGLLIGQIQFFKI
jgi:deoxycytidine triphosphate deaminase